MREQSVSKVWLRKKASTKIGFPSQQATFGPGIKDPFGERIRNLLLPRPRTGFHLLPEESTSEVKIMWNLYREQNGYLNAKK